MSDYTLLKFIILGDSGVGKSNIAMRFCEDKYVQENEPTIGVDFYVKTIEISNEKEPKNYKLQLWDTAGQERYLSITKTYFRDCCGIILVYDVTRRETYINILAKWLPIIAMECPATAKVILVGNKSDSTRRVVTADEVKRAVNEIKNPKGESQAIFKRINGWCECSAKMNSGNGVDHIFHQLSRYVIEELSDDKALPIGVKLYKEMIEEKVDEQLKMKLCCFME